jgi:hypothetical protein
VQQDADSVGSGGIAGFHGRLHTLATFDGNVFVSALGGDGQWAHVGNDSQPDAPVDPQSIATDGSTLYRAYITGSGETPRLEVDFLAGSTWTALENGVPAGSVPKSATLRGAAGGGVWVLSEETAAGVSSFQLSLYNAAE